MKTIFLKKGETLQTKGDISNQVFAVKSGLLRSYTIDDKGKEHIFMFAPEGWLMADNVEADQTCSLHIDAIEDSIIVQLDRKEELDLDPKKIEKRLVVLQKRIIMLMSASALERYEDFVQTYPNIVQRVPQKMIASYLGLTPEALSKVKNLRFKK